MCWPVVPGDFAVYGGPEVASEVISRCCLCSSCLELGKVWEIVQSVSRFGLQGEQTVLAISLRGTPKLIHALYCFTKWHRFMALFRLEETAEK